MLYLIDSSAKNSFGHNLEYLERITLCAKSQSVILGNKELDPNGDSRYRPTFEFSTWDFGRFGLQRKKSKIQGSRDSKSLRSSKSLLITEELIEKTSEFVARFIGKQVLYLVCLSKQSRSFFRDIAEGLADADHLSTILVSTANARELLGLKRWLRLSGNGESRIVVILRRPILDLRSIPEIPLMFFDALIHIALIRNLANRVSFVADTPELAASVNRRTGVSINEVPAMGFDTQTKVSTGPLEIAIAPNFRPETRFSFKDATSLRELGDASRPILDSSSYRQLLSTTRSLVLPYDPLRYRLRSSGIFTEALTLGILPIVPTGTSMSREITKLNSSILQKFEHRLELKVGDKLDLSQFGQENFLFTLESSSSGSLVLEFSDSLSRVKKQTCDFYAKGSKDSFFFQSSKQVFFSFKTEKMFFEDERLLSISVNRVPTRLFGASYLEDDLEGIVRLTKEIEFQGSDTALIQLHSPASICRLLEI